MNELIITLLMAMGIAVSDNDKVSIFDASKNGSKVISTENVKIVVTPNGKVIVNIIALDDIAD